MGLLLKVIGACVIAETVGNKIQSIKESSNASRQAVAIAETNAHRDIVRMREDTKRENARLNAEIEKMRSETERANELIRAEARVAAERIRASSMVATASIVYGAGNYPNAGNNFVSSDLVQNRNNGGLYRNNEPAYLEANRAAIPELPHPMPRFCGRCGSELIPGSYFCRNCGNRIR